MPFSLPSKPGLLFLTFNPDTTKALFQALTVNYDEEGSPEEGALQQVGMTMIHTLATLQLVDQLKQVTPDKKDEMVDETGVVVVDLAERERDDVLDSLMAMYVMCFTPIGKSCLANVFTMEDNLECLLAYAELKGE